MTDCISIYQFAQKWDQIGQFIAFWATFWTQIAQFNIFYFLAKTASVIIWPLFRLWVTHLHPRWAFFTLTYW